MIRFSIFGDRHRLLDPEPGSGGGGTTTAPSPAKPPAAKPPIETQTGMTAADMDALVGKINAHIDSQLDAQLTPIRESQTQLETRIEGLSAPVLDMGQFFRQGGGPAIIKGELPGKAEARGFQFTRLLGLMQKDPNVSAEMCKYELDLSARLTSYYRTNGFQFAGSGSVMLMPLGSAMLPNELPDVEVLRDEIRQSFSRGIRGADTAELFQSAYRAGVPHERINQTLSMFDDSALGVFTHGGTTGEFIELLRAVEVFSRAGATQVALPPNGQLPFGAQTGTATCYWVGENQTITNSEPATGAKSLLAKKLAALVKCPNELIRFGNPSVEAFLRQDMALSMARTLDLAMLEGVGSTASIKGLINHGIQTRIATTVATHGDALEPKDLSLMVSDVEEAKHDVESQGFTYVMRPKMWTNILNRRAGSGFADADGEGGWLFAINREDARNGAPMLLNGYPVVKSTQVSNTRVKGNGADLTYVLGGVFRHWLIGRLGVMELATNTQSDEAFSKYQTHLRAIQHVDAIPRYEDAFVMIDDIDMDLPA